MHRVVEPGEARTKGPDLPAWHYWVYWAGVLAALAAALTAFGVIRWGGAHTTLQDTDPTYSSEQVRRFSSSAGIGIRLRRLYPYSVIPGGVEDAQELRNAVASDPLVAELYANFDLSRAHIVRLAKDQEVYVSYRLGGQIYWTKKRLLLRTGESVITDGTHEARTRCGNRVSTTPMQPVAPNEPPNAAAAGVAPPFALVAQNSTLPLLPPLDPPSLDPADPGLPMFPEPPSTSAVNLIPPPIFPIVGGGPSSFPNVIPPPPVSAPEPRAISLLGVGLLALAAARMSTFGRYRKA